MTAHSHKGTAGLLPNDKIRATPKPIPASVIERFRRLNDLSSTVSDILDKFGVIGCVGASTLRPTIGDAQIVGRAMTVRNVAQRQDIYLNAKEDNILMNEMEAIHQSSPGDVLVIQGAPDTSNMGGLVATLCKRAEMVGAVVDGGVRDVGRSRSIQFPIWSKHVSPITGKFRCVTEEINGPVLVAGLTVEAGDLVIADETGVCFVPQAIIEDVLAKCEEIHKVENDWDSDFSKGLSIPDLMKKIYPRLRDK
jgi:4-hydroxy-4-methyl-2-oxoglutarate aldolase